MALSLAACERAADKGTGVAAALRPGPAPVQLDLPGYLAHLPKAPLGMRDIAGGGLAEQVRTFYSQRQQQPAWFENGRLRAEAKPLVDFLAGLAAQGLEPQDFQPDALAKAVDGLERGQPAVKPEEVEVGLTWAAMLAGAQLRYGRVTPKQVNAKWELERPKADLVKVMNEGLQGRNLPERLRQLNPKHPQFVGLLQALERYREIARRGGWPEVPKGDVIGAGEKGDAERLRLLAQRLQAEGFLQAVPPSLAQAPKGTKVPMPAELAEGIKRFQQTRTLETDGKLGPETQEELQVPIWGRLRQVQLNLERWRWVPDDFGQRAVMVNVPGYMLDVVEGNRIAMSMRTVVGEEGWETPIFRDRIRFLTLNPYWTVPPGIYKKELAPKIARDPGYMARHDMEVTQNGDTVRQRPGPKNPLGLVKFMFPNEHDVYLHDTPADALFAEADRNRSHGCIRLEKPFELADYLLREDPKWGGGIRNAIATGETRDVPLKEPVPVFILYFTAAVRPNGELEFYEDIYGIDHAQEAQWEAMGSLPPGSMAPRGRAPVGDEEEEAVQQQPGDETAGVSPEGDPARPGSIRIERANTGEQLNEKPAQKPAQKPGPGRQLETEGEDDQEDDGLEPRPRVQREVGAEDAGDGAGGTDQRHG